MLKKRFEQNPGLKFLKEDLSVLKNFGFHSFADSDDADRALDEEEPEPNIFEGDI